MEICSYLMNSFQCWVLKQTSINTEYFKCSIFLVMLRAWRERDQEKRIKTAHQALEHNAKYVS